MTPSNFIPAPPAMARAMAAFFDQFEMASPRFVTILSLADYAAIIANEELPPGSKAWWDRQIRASHSDGKAAAIEFRDRMRAERDQEK